MDEFGDTLHGYEILAKIGQGTSGVVYKVRYTLFNRIAALKTPLTDPAIEYSLRKQRFLRESQVLASFGGKPGGPIPVVHHVFEQDGRIFYQREFVEGETLEHVVTNKSIQLKEAVQILASIARTVQWVHERQFVHRNLHPSNILVATDGSAKLIGFGRVAWIDPLAVPAGQPRPSVDIDVQTLQKTLDWLCFFLRQPVPPCVEKLRYSQLPPTAGEFAEFLENCAHDKNWQHSLRTT